MQQEFARFQGCQRQARGAELGGEAGGERGALRLAEAQQAAMIQVHAAKGRRSGARELRSSSCRPAARAAPRRRCAPARRPPDRRVRAAAASQSRQPPASAVRAPKRPACSIPGSRMRPAASAARSPPPAQVQIGEDDDDFAHGRYRTAIVKFTLESAPGGNLHPRLLGRPRSASASSACRCSCIVTAERALDRVGPGDLRRVQQRTPASRSLALEPELVLLGHRDAPAASPAAEIRNALAARGIGLEAMQLGAACRTFNVLVQEERRVAAALFLS